MGKEGRKGQMGRARGCQLDRQWQAIQAATDRSDCRNVGIRYLEVGPGSLSPHHEELHGRRRKRDIRGQRQRRVWLCERQDHKDALAGDVQDGAAGRQDRQQGAGGEKRGQEGSGLGNMFDIV
jgi:hypothetical protein